MAAPSGAAACFYNINSFFMCDSSKESLYVPCNGQAFSWVCLNRINDVVVVKLLGCLVFMKRKKSKIQALCTSHAHSRVCQVMKSNSRMRIWCDFLTHPFVCLCVG
jgi:hypothetical protein